MTASIVRGRHVITRTLDRHRWEQIDDGAVLQEDGTITAVGTFAALRSQHPDVPVIGSGEEVVLPGFVNAHHHIGLTPVQLGSPDMPLELWFATRLVVRDVDPYLDTLYSAFEMIASGITTVQHIHGWAPGGAKEVEARADRIISAYEDIGMRVSYCYSLRDQNFLVYAPNDAFMESVPAEIRPALARHFARFRMDAADTVGLFEALHARHNAKNRVKIQLAPANLHWCSDGALELVAAASERFDSPLHMHLLETPYQKEYARRRSGGTAVDHIARFGLLGPRMTLGHGVWLNEADIERIAETGTHICHNCSSNFRLRSGIAPLNRLEAKGINVAIGIDEAGINDDRDMLQEMRMVLRTHREPGMDDRVPTMAQVLRIATAGGARTTPFGTQLGTLEVGRAADMVLIDWDGISFPYLDAEMPVLDAVIQRAKAGSVRTVMVDGEVIYRDGGFARVDRGAVLQEFAKSFERELNEGEAERRRLSQQILPYVKAFYENYFDQEKHLPYYWQSSRQ
jgi:cytosine/adenosine deaminase-related metal-dependent hydrolase